MKAIILASLCILVSFALIHTVNAQAQASELSPTKWGVILDSPAMKNVLVKKDVPYLKDDRGTLSIDIYSPAGSKASDKRPAVIFLNAIGDRTNDKVKNWAFTVAGQS